MTPLKYGKRVDSCDSDSRNQCNPKAEWEWETGARRAALSSSSSTSPTPSPSSVAAAARRDNDNELGFALQDFGERFDRFGVYTTFVRSIISLSH